MFRRASGVVFRSSASVAFFVCTSELVRTFEEHVTWNRIVHGTSLFAEVSYRRVESRIERTRETVVFSRRLSFEWYF